MWSRSTKQRRSAMRRRQSHSVRHWMLFLTDPKWTDINPALRSALDSIRSRLTNDALIGNLRTAEEQQALYEQRPFVPNPRTSMHAAHYLNAPLVALTPPKEQ